jgi:predicted RNA binding protein YcfA (HicA-like mRNA interferase family)
MANIKNIPLKKFRRFLQEQGCKHIRTNGGHEVWTRYDLLRPVVVQTHIDPVPPRIVRQIIDNLGVEEKTFLKDIDNL